MEVRSPIRCARCSHDCAVAYGVNNPANEYDLVNSSGVAVNRRSYRLLDLTAPQRVQIAALQEQRDTVLHDARQRHRPARLDEARQRFIDEVHPLLTPTQQAELDQFNANIEANFHAVWEIELAGFPLPEPLAARTDPDDGPPIPQYVLAQGRLVGERLREILTKLAAKAPAAPVVK